ncbi:MAG: alpha/beta fold hydrolase [Marivibrio sp.]|uniref:alpha/beta fold hydrolase n=1 Tax=Marivibrio sp. TaxID=2039719 RepID=UPI0032EC1D05
MLAEMERIALNYELEGPGDAPVVLFSHSLAADLTMFDAQMSAFRAGGYRILRYDMRGHGKSPPPAPAQRRITMEDLADDAVALMDRLGIARAHWVGLSIGGMIGQMMGLRHPDRVESLTLTSTASAVPAEAAPMWDERIAKAKQEGMEALVEGTIERWFTRAARTAALPEIAPVRRMIANTSVEGFVACCGAIKQWRFTERLPEIRKPALVVQGREDPGTTVEAGQVIAEHLPGARIEVVEDAAHLANIEQAERWTAIVKDWVDANARV